MTLTRDEAQAIVQKILSQSKADAIRVSINGGRSSNLRFARNTVTTSGSSRDLSISLTATFGKKSGTYSFNQFDTKTLQNAVRRAEELARLAPEDPEYMPPLEPQKYQEVSAFVESTTNVTPEFRAGIAGDCIKMCEGKNLVAAGFIQDSEGISFFANSMGLTAYHSSTNISYSITARTQDGTGSGWATAGHNDAALLDGGVVSRRAVERAVASVNARAIEPGKYTVVLEPDAVSDLLGSVIFSMDARSADEGRSYFADVDGKNKVGQKLFPDFVTLVSDPSHPEAPGFPWGEDGLPSRRTVWVEKGVLKNLRYSRYWAKKMEKAPLPFPRNTIMQGGTASLEDLISSTEKGILVTRFWYIRSVDPKTILLTGLTRDGTFWIENGKIAYPIRNFRFNESPIAMLKNIEMMSKSVRLQSGSRGDLIPALKVKEFTFSSLSDAV